MPNYLPSGEYYSTSEAAEIIGISTNRVRQLVRDKHIKGFDFGSNTRVCLIPAAEVYRLRDAPYTTGRPRGPAEG